MQELVVPPRASHGRRVSLARRIGLALATMLLPLVAVAATGVFVFRTSIGALEEFREETVEETKLIETVRDDLVEADDLGEAMIEEGDPTVAGEFGALSDRIEKGFDTLETLSTAQERELAEDARDVWHEVERDLVAAEAIPDGEVTDDRLDPFHDHVDVAASLLADLRSLNASQVGAEIASLREREQVQLIAVLATLVIGCVVAGLLAGRVRRSIIAPLLALERAAAEFGSDDLSHRVPVKGDDELARVGSAFNEMAGKLQGSRDELHHHALHDQLTGLPNRAIFMLAMDKAIARARRKGTPFSVLYADLDGFKAVNDTLGHEAGDEVLKIVAQRLTVALRTEDVAARLGGDEFGILLDGSDQAGAARAAERLTRAFAAPMWINAGPVSVGISVGAATSLGDDGLDQLLRHADTAMYSAKARGKGQWQAFGDGLGFGFDRPGKQAIGLELQLALERQEFVVRYQPILDLETGAIVAVEALVRWDHPERGLLLPADFLDVAEETGQILAIDKFVLQTACQQVRAWQRDLPGAAELCASVNLSSKQLEHPGLIEEVADALRVSGLAPRHLILEATETAFLHDTELAESELRRVKTLGVQLALDDFGTGYSSLAHILHFPVDIIKIDREFVAAMGNDEQRSQMALALVTLGQTLGLRIVAEGIEEVEQIDLLRAAQCDFGQGYLIARPLQADDLGRLLALGPPPHVGSLTPTVDVITP